MAMMVPKKKDPRKEYASSFGRVRAGRRRKRESGWRPWMVPVM
jgi:hypothetical protein